MKVTVIRSNRKTVAIQVNCDPVSYTHLGLLYGKRTENRPHRNKWYRKDHPFKKLIRINPSAFRKL